MHEPADWTNAALYAGMAEWAKIAGDDKYYNWLKGIGEKNGWTYYHEEDPRSRYREMTEVYGVGAFLLAGTEVCRLVKSEKLKVKSEK